MSILSDEFEPIVKMPNGRSVKGKKLSFKTIKEDWNEYELEDGTRLYVKLVLIDVVRLNMLNQFGEPVYQIASHNLVKVRVSRKAVEEVSEKVKPGREQAIA